MSKGIKENKLTVMTKRLLLMCTNENNDKKKKKNLPSPFHTSDTFLNF